MQCGPNASFGTSSQFQIRTYQYQHGTQQIPQGTLQKQ